MNASIGFSNILVPLDGSSTAEAAIPYALDLAEKYRSRVVLYRVATVPPAHWGSIEIPLMGTHLGTTGTVLSLQNHEIYLCQEYLKGVLERFSNPAVTMETQHDAGQPADLIITKAAELGDAVIVISSHGRDGLGRWLLGSVAEKVARHASGPVMILRAPGAVH